MMRVFSVPELCCPDCAKKIDAALEDAGIDHEVDFEGKKVSVCDCDHCMGVAFDLLKEMGFEAERIS